MAEKMTLGQKLAVAKAIHDGLLRNGTVVMYSGTFQRIIADAIDAYLAQHAQAVDVRAEAYAERLARALWRKHYADDAPQWEPLTGDLLGMLSQIDNMTTGLTRAIGNAQAEE